MDWPIQGGWVAHKTELKTEKGKQKDSKKDKIAKGWETDRKDGKR